MTAAEQIKSIASPLQLILQATKNCVLTEYIPTHYCKFIFIDASVLEIRFYETSILTKVNNPK